MAVVASRIVARITHEGISRAPLIAGITRSRVASLGFPKTPIRWAMAGFVAARLSSQSVLPKLCKKHLQYPLRNSHFGNQSKPPTEFDEEPKLKCGERDAFAGKCDATRACASRRYATFGISVDLSGSSLALVSRWFTVPKPQDRAYLRTFNYNIWVDLGAQRLVVEQLTASSGECSIRNQLGQ